MNAPVTAPAFARKLEAIADTFEAWVQRDGKEARPLDIAADTLAEAEQAAALHASHKDILFIRRTEGLTGKQTLHVYQVRRSSKTFIQRGAYDGPYQVRVGTLYADPITALPIKAFAPVEPFRWTPGCDVVGVDRGIVEQRP